MSSAIFSLHTRYLSHNFKLWEESATTEAKGIQREYTLSFSTATRGGGWAREVDCDPGVPMN